MVTGRDVIRLLERRGGFDHWWDDIDADIQEEIVAELDNLLGAVSPPRTEED